MKSDVRGETFGIIPKWVLTHPDLTDHAVRVYGLLAWRIGRDKERTVSLAWVADQIGGSESSHRRALADLQTVGAITIGPLFDPDHGGQVGNVYHVHFDQALTTPPPVTHESPPPLTSDTPHKEVDLRGTTDLKALDLKTVDPPVTRAVRESDEFVQFYERVYPRKQGRGAARRAWEGAVRKAPAEVILAAAVRFRFDANRVPQFTPHPATWLNQERWGDDPLPPSSARPPLGVLDSIVLEARRRQNGDGHATPSGGDGSDLGGMLPELTDGGDPGR